MVPVAVDPRWPAGPPPTEVVSAVMFLAFVQSAPSLGEKNTETGDAALGRRQVSGALLKPRNVLVAEEGLGGLGAVSCPVAVGFKCGTAV